MLGASQVISPSRCRMTSSSGSECTRASLATLGSSSCGTADCRSFRLVSPSMLLVSTYARPPRSLLASSTTSHGTCS
eukprot:scaffold139_cov246-Pinguiococcus_pyrenoidosus.AAC.5